jgi:hypothetical protein
MEKYKMNFLDLEPVLGSCDHIWDDFVYEINHYPYRHEAAFVSRPDHKESTRYLLKEYARFKRRKEQLNVSTKAYHNANHALLPETWTDAWNNYVQDTRITLVEKNDTADGNFLPGTVFEDRLEYFPKFWEYVKSLPIDTIYSAIFINGSPNAPLPVHKDWLNQEDPCEARKMHMLFINPKNNRPFYYKVGERKVFTNTSLFLFNSAAAEHGVIAEPHRTSLFRIYCKLNDDFCDNIGVYKVKGYEA